MNFLFSNSLHTYILNWFEKNSSVINQILINREFSVNFCHIFNKISQNLHGKVKYRCDVDFASAIKALISRIIDSFFSGASLGTKSRAEIAILKAFLASVWLPNCVKQEPFLWCSLCARFFGYLYLKANSISWRQSTVTRYYRFGTQTFNTLHTLKIIIFSLYVLPKLSTEQT